MQTKLCKGKTSINVMGQVREVPKIRVKVESNGRNTGKQVILTFLFPCFGHLGSFMLGMFCSALME